MTEEIDVVPQWFSTASAIAVNQSSAFAASNSPYVIRTRPSSVRMVSTPY